MGLIGNVLLLPLAPVRGVGWVARILLDEAEAERAASASPARALEELAAAVANGEISPADAEALEAELVMEMLAGANAPEGG